MAVDGTWNITLSTPMGERPAQLTLKTDGNALSGTFGSERGSQEFSGGTVDGNNVSWKTMFNGAMGPMELTFSGTVDGDTIGGTVQFGAFGSGTWKGTRA
ncbi:hypothetical protein [Tepidiforma thermophila]|uniref:Uncharacterized protein n=1 Tax=Tepidiforma thermophila (strain KCTC 52669 / CGMCC 1.13589 / G233) TaxID=2761530 RepID=A0A2A9HCA5_TEPT2|nr:hypothetical protein [Tepidiforma thermophila]PFG73637.1 hypothetical protein A9A59_0839 [Tepidiforma thermophila]